MYKTIGTMICLIQHKNSIRTIINRDTLTICFLAFNNDFYNGIITPIATLYFLSLGASFTFIGTLVSIQSFLYILFALPFGTYSDRKGRKFPVIFSYITSSISNVFYSLATSFYHLLPVKIFQSFGTTAYGSSFQAYIADVTERTRLDEVIGLYMVSMGLGVITGPLVSGWVVSGWGYRTAYLLASSIALVGLLVGFFGLRSGVVTGLRSGVRPDKTTQEARERPNLIKSLKTIFRNPLLLSALILNSMNQLAYALILEYFPAYSRNVGFTVVEIGSLFFIRGIFTTVIRFPISLLGKRVGNKTVMIFSLIGSIIGLFLLPYFQDFRSLAVMMAIQGACFGAFLASYMAYLFKMIDASQRGITLATNNIFSQTLSMLYGPLRGSVADAVGVGSGFPFMASICTVGTAISFIISSRRVSTRIKR